MKLKIVNEDTDTDRIILRIIGVGCLTGLITINWLFWNWTFTLTTAKFVVMTIMWVIFGSWTSLIGGIISLWMIFGSD